MNGHLKWQDRDQTDTNTRIIHSYIYVVCFYLCAEFCDPHSYMSTLNLKITLLIYPCNHAFILMMQIISKIVLLWPCQNTVNCPTPKKVKLTCLMAIKFSTTVRLTTMSLKAKSSLTLLLSSLKPLLCYLYVLVSY